MQSFENICREKTDAELIDIYIYPNSYQKAFLESATAELVRRGNSEAELNEKLRLQWEKEDEAHAVGRRGNRLYLLLIGLAAVLGGVVSVLAAISMLFQLRPAIPEMCFMYMMMKPVNGEGSYSGAESVPLRLGFICVWRCDVFRAVRGVLLVKVVAYCSSLCGLCFCR